MSAVFHSKCTEVQKLRGHRERAAKAAKNVGGGGMNTPAFLQMGFPSGIARPEDRLTA